jgi:NADH dehydrogenase [ubiquinone] 1 alpha subcomplex assembly factor 2
MDIVRQAQMKQLAAQADARWASQAERLDMPQRQEIASAALPQRPSNHQPEITDPVSRMEDAVKEVEGQARVVEEVQKEEKREAMKRERKDSTTYQGLKLGKEGEQAPESWTPRPARRR